MARHKHYSDKFKADCIAIYGLRHKDSDKYFYIGSTKHDIQRRFEQHRAYTSLGYNRNRHFCNKVNQLGWDNIEIDLLTQCDPDKRHEVEYEYINNFRDNGHPLTNILYNHDYEPTQDIGDDFKLEKRHIEDMLHYFHAPIDDTQSPLFNEFHKLLKKAMGIALSDWDSVLSGVNE